MRNATCLSSSFAHHKERQNLSVFKGKINVFTATITKNKVWIFPCFSPREGKLKCCSKSWVVDIPPESDFGNLLLMSSQVDLTCFYSFSRSLVFIPLKIHSHSGKKCDQNKELPLSTWVFVRLFTFINWMSCNLIGTQICSWNLAPKRFSPCICKIKSVGCPSWCSPASCSFGVIST